MVCACNCSLSPVCTQGSNLSTVSALIGAKCLLFPVSKTRLCSSAVAADEGRRLLRYRRRYRYNLGLADCEAAFDMLQFILALAALHQRNR